MLCDSNGATRTTPVSTHMSICGLSARARCGGKRCRTDEHWRSRGAATKNMGARGVVKGGAVQASMTEHALKKERSRELRAASLHERRWGCYDHPEPSAGP